MATKTIPITIELSELEHRWLIRLAERAGVSKTRWCRRLVQQQIRTEAVQPQAEAKKTA